eukprot:3358394-Pleurochrysis_carterae.AAC.2
MIQRSFVGWGLFRIEAYRRYLMWSLYGMYDGHAHPLRSQGNELRRMCYRPLPLSGQYASTKAISISNATANKLDEAKPLTVTALPVAIPGAGPAALLCFVCGEAIFLMKPKGASHEKGCRVSLSLAKKF